MKAIRRKTRVGYVFSLVLCIVALSFSVLVELRSVALFLGCPAVRRTTAAIVKALLGYFCTINVGPELAFGPIHGEIWVKLNK